MARKQHEYHYIYKTTCSVTGKYYIGMHSTSKLEDAYLGSGKILRRSINKHGIENHSKEILEFLPDRNSLKNREKQLVNETNLSDPMCMNLKFGGEGGWPQHSKEVLSELGKRLNETRWKDPAEHAKQAKVGSETFKRLHKDGKIKSPDWTGRSHRSETKEKIGEKSAVHQVGSGNSQYGTRWITNGTQCKKLKISQALPVGWVYGKNIKQ